MTDDGIGRVLVASLHQAIGDILPLRLDYYEHWLTPTGLKDGRTGLAPLGAVLSFLRREGPEVYDRVMATAGQHSAEWHYQQGGRTQGALRLLPHWLRARVALRRSRSLLQSAFTPARVKVSVRRGVGKVSVTAGVFCSLRETWPWPTCRYYAAAVERHLALQGVVADVQITTCQAVGDGECAVQVTFRRPGRERSPDQTPTGETT